MKSNPTTTIKKKEGINECLKFEGGKRQFFKSINELMFLSPHQIAHVPGPWFLHAARSGVFGALGMLEKAATEYDHAFPLPEGPSGAQVALITVLFVQD